MNHSWESTISNESNICRKITFYWFPPMRSEFIRKRRFWRFCPRIAILCVQYVRNPMVEPGVFFDFWWFWTDSSVWENSFRLSSAHERALFQNKIIHSRIILNLCLLAWPKIGYFLAISAVHFFLIEYITLSDIWEKVWDRATFFFKANLTFFGLRSAKKVGRSHWKNG